MYFIAVAKNIFLFTQQIILIITIIIYGIVINLKANENYIISINENLRNKLVLFFRILKPIIMNLFQNNALTCALKFTIYTF